MFCLHRRRAREVEGGGALRRSADDMKIRKARHLRAVEAAHTVLPFRLQRLPAAPHGLVAADLVRTRADIEAGSEDDAIGLVFDAAGNHAGAGDPFDPAAIGIGQFNIVAVEGPQGVVAVERAACR